MSTYAQMTHKWVTWTDWSQIRQVLLCFGIGSEMSRRQFR